MKVLIRANSEDKPFSKTNAYFNRVLENDLLSLGTIDFKRIWSDLTRSSVTTNKVSRSHTFLIVDLPDTPITIEEFLDQYPELLL
jgi:hypothetical protein